MNSVSRMIARPQLWAKLWKNFSSHRIGRDSERQRDVDGLVERRPPAAARRVHRLEVGDHLRAREERERVVDCPLRAARRARANAASTARVPSGCAVAAQPRSCGGDSG